MTGATRKSTDFLNVRDGNRCGSGAAGGMNECRGLDRHIDPRRAALAPEESLVVDPRSAVTPAQWVDRGVRMMLQRLSPHRALPPDEGA